jgi:hypothetical protein
MPLPLTFSRSPNTKDIDITPRLSYLLGASPGFAAAGGHFIGLMLTFYPSL